MGQRIRSLKPDLSQDEELGRCSREARYLFVLLITFSDDYGRWRATPELLRNALYPYDARLRPQTVAKWLAELEKSGRVRTYVVDGQTYGELVNWDRHQRIDNAGKSTIPLPPWSSIVQGSSEASIALGNGASIDMTPTSEPAIDRPLVHSNGVRRNSRRVHRGPPLDQDQDLDGNRSPPTPPGGFAAARDALANSHRSTSEPKPGPVTQQDTQHETLVLRLMAVCSAKTAEGFREQAVHVIAWASMFLDTKLIEEVIGGTVKWRDRPKLPKAVATALHRAATDKGITIEPFPNRVLEHA